MVQVWWCWAEGGRVVVLALRKVWRAVMPCWGNWSSSVLLFWRSRIAAGSAIDM